MELHIQFLTPHFHVALEWLSMIYPVDRRADAPLHHRTWQLTPVQASVKCHGRAFTGKSWPSFSHQELMLGV